MGKFNFIETEIKDVYIIEPTVFGDNRGYFMETYNYEEFAAAGLDMKFVQDNQSMSKKGVLRGVHSQKDFPQGKLVRVISGVVFDVALDLRRNSPTSMLKSFQCGKRRSQTTQQRKCRPISSKLSQKS